MMPVLIYEANKQHKYVVLVGFHGGPMNNDLLDYIGVPIQITGKLFAMDNCEVLHIDSRNEIRILCYKENLSEYSYPTDKLM